MISELNLIGEFLQDFDFRNPSTFYIPEDYFIETSDNDVLGLKAKISEILFLLDALLIEHYSIEKVTSVAEEIYNLSCTEKRSICKVDGAIAIQSVNVPTMDFEGIKSKVSQLKAWEKDDGFKLSSEVKTTYDTVNAIADNILKKNPVDYIYSSIEIVGDNSKDISELEQEIDRTIEYLTGLLETRKDYHLALLLVKLRVLLNKGCTEAKAYSTENILKVEKVEGNFTDAIASIKEIFNSIVEWKVENYGRDESDPQLEPKGDNPAPVPKKGRPSILAYFALSSKNGKYCSLEGTDIQHTINKYNQFYITSKIADLTPSDRNYPDYYNYFVFSQTGDRTASIAARGGSPRGHNNTGMMIDFVSHTIKNNYYARAVPSDYIGLQYSTGKNAFVAYSRGKVSTYSSFNPYNKPITVENIDRGTFKVTFIGCNFPGILLLESCTNGDNNNTRGTIGVTEKLEIVDGNATVIVKFYERMRTGNKDMVLCSSIQGFYAAYLGSYHPLVDANPDIRATLFSNAWENNFIDTNSDSDEIAIGSARSSTITLATADTPAKIEFKGHQKNRQGYTFINIHANPKFPDIIPHLSLSKVNSYSIEYDVFDARTQQIIKEPFPVSVLSFQV